MNNIFYHSSILYAAQHPFPEAWQLFTASGILLESLAYGKSDIFRMSYPYAQV
jgi:hypothetical protein